MGILFIIPLFLIALWLYSETKPDVLRRIVYGSLTLVTLFAVTALTVSHPKEKAMRRAAYSGLEQALRAGDTNAALAALQAYHGAPTSRWRSDVDATYQMVRLLNAAKRGETRR